ncbi:MULTISPECIES: carbohydrate ABC transporter permease [unclassified Inquilinus]|jgi:multiple sugar transport system permease protein|uniref:carbohydrate ABC transporter permease n=1 Tax=unclassified Inquilinus TaxID=2645927 RepID=UPI003F9030B9
MNTATHAIPGARPGSFRRTLGNALEPWLYLSPALILLTVSLLVPLIVGLSYAFQDFGPFKSSWVGLKNFQTLLHDANFWRALKNTVWWTVGSLFFQFFGGLGLAMLLNRPFRGKRLVQALVFLPWAVPTFLSGLVFAWLFNPVVGPLPYWLAGLGILPEPFNILSDPDLAMWGPILANVWFGIPFFAITLLAALQAIPSDFYEAAAIDGATAWQRFTKITIPFLAPTIAITVLLRTIWIATFADLIWVMTNGGPANSTSILSTYIFAQAFTRLDFGYASAIATVLLLLLLLYAGILIRMRKSLLAGQ